MVGLQERIQDLPKELSGGEQQKILNIAEYNLNINQRLYKKEELVTSYKLKKLIRNIQFFIVIVQS